MTATARAAPRAHLPEASHGAQARAEERERRALAGQVALVTGGERGLGRAFAPALAAAGAAVAVAARSRAEVEETTALIGAADGCGLVRDWFLDRLAEGREVLLECAAELALLLAQGQADALSGRYRPVYDDVRALIARAEETRRDHLYTLRLHERGGV